MVFTTTSLLILKCVKVRPFQPAMMPQLKLPNRLPLELIPVGSVVYAIELTPGRGAQMVRAAGASAQLMAKENGYATLRMPSGEVRKVLVTCEASLGTVSNVQHQNIKIGVAGRRRRKGIRPTVRGAVMNVTDHPHGGGDLWSSRFW